MSPSGQMRGREVREMESIREFGCQTKCPNVVCTVANTTAGKLAGLFTESEGNACVAGMAWV